MWNRAELHGDDDGADGDGDFDVITAMDLWSVFEFIVATSAEGLSCETIFCHQPVE